MKSIFARFAPFWSAPLHVRLRWLRWIIPSLIPVGVVFLQVGLHFLARVLPANWSDVVAVLVYGSLGAMVSCIALSRATTLFTARARAEEQLRSAYAELEANHQRLLTLQNLGGQVAGADNEQTVLELAVQAPLQLTGALASTVITFDDEQDRLKLDMAWGLSDDYLHALRLRMDQGIPAGRCRKCMKLKTHASSDCPLFVGLHQAAQAEGIGGLICLPMTIEQERTGIISAYFPSPDGPPEEQVRLLHILTGAIAAMLESMRQRNRHVDTVYALKQASQAVDLSASAIGDFSDQVLNMISAGWGAQAGGLFLYDEKTQAWVCHARRGLGEDLSAPCFNLALEMARQAHSAGTAVIEPDLGAGGESGLLSTAAAPLIAEGRKLGAIFLGARRARAFQSQHANLLETMALQVALAIRNVQLYDQLDQLAVLKERYRLSRELHDGLAQTLASLNLQAEHLEMLIQAQRTEAAGEEIGRIRQAIYTAYTDVREAIEGLRLDLDQPEQMAVLLSDYLTQFSRQTGIQAQLAIDPEGLLVAPATALQLLRIVQEALSNVRKHAQASQIKLRLKATGSELELMVTDNGLGFPETMPADLNRHHFGLVSMRERANSLGGTFSVATGTHQGTRITVTIPASHIQKQGAYSP